MTGGDPFWTALLDANWETRAVEIDLPADRALLAEADAFAIAADASEQYRDGATPDLRWAHGPHRPLHLGAQHRDAYAPLLPRRSDGTPRAYVQRLARDGVDSFFMQVSQIQAHSPALWRRIHRFAENVYRHAGIPANRTWSDIYVGKYAATPFGVHVDHASNFTFGVTGKKTLYLWEPEYYFARMKHGANEDYRQHVAQAITLTVTPGKLIYWPARYFHIADSHGELSITANVAFYLTQSTSLSVGKVLVDALSRRANGRDHSEPAAFASNPRVPRTLRAATRELERMALDGTLRRELLAAHLRHVSTLGFQHTPALEGVDRVADTQPVRADPQLPIHWLALDDETVGCAFLGSSMEIAAPARIGWLFRELNRGRAFTTKELARRAAAECGVAPKVIRNVIATLVAWHALRPVERTDDA